jgi:hypothetical protein
MEPVPSQDGADANIFKSPRLSHDRSISPNCLIPAFGRACSLRKLVDAIFRPNIVTTVQSPQALITWFAGTVFAPRRAEQSRVAHCPNSRVGLKVLRSQSNLSFCHWKSSYCVLLHSCGAESTSRWDSWGELLTGRGTSAFAWGTNSLGIDDCLTNSESSTGTMTCSICVNLQELCVD